MNAGLPGTGIGGLFYILLALLMPLRELYLTVRGRSSVERWSLVGRQFAIACGILAALVATQAFFLDLLSGGSLQVTGAPLTLAPLMLAAVLLGVVIATLRVWALLVPAPPKRDDGRRGKVYGGSPRRGVR